VTQHPCLCTRCSGAAPQLCLAQGCSCSCACLCLQAVYTAHVPALGAQHAVWPGCAACLGWCSGRESVPVFLLQASMPRSGAQALQLVGWLPARVRVLATSQPRRVMSLRQFSHSRACLLPSERDLLAHTALPWRAGMRPRHTSSVASCEHLSKVLALQQLWWHHHWGLLHVGQLRPCCPVALADHRGALRSAACCCMHGCMGVCCMSPRTPDVTAPCVHAADAPASSSLPRTVTRQAAAPPGLPRHSARRPATASAA
jgi:hypothetical protein